MCRFISEMEHSLLGMPQLTYLANVASTPTSTLFPMSSINSHLSFLMLMLISLQKETRELTLC
jgi:hypothetical protein